MIKDSSSRLEVDQIASDRPDDEVEAWSAYRRRRARISQVTGGQDRNQSLGPPSRIL